MPEPRPGTDPADPVFREVLAHLAATLTREVTLEETVAELVRYSVRALGVHHGGVTLVGPRRTLTTVGPSDPVVAEVDRLQGSLGEGACLDAAHAVRAVVATDLSTDARWPRWGPAAAGAGLPAVVSTPLQARGRCLGALNLYGEPHETFAEQDLVLTRVLADQAAHAIAAVRTTTDLERALSTRTTVSQAQGILMERYGIDADRAFAVLKRHSQDTNTKLHDVADRIVEDTTDH